MQKTLLSRHSCCPTVLAGPAAIIAPTIAAAGITSVSLAINVADAPSALFPLGDTASGAGLAFSLLAVREAFGDVENADDQERICFLSLVISALLYLLLINVWIELLIIICTVSPYLSFFFLKTIMHGEVQLRTEKNDVFDLEQTASPRKLANPAKGDNAQALTVSFVTPALMVLFAITQGILLASSLGDAYPDDWSSVIGSAILASVLVVLIIGVPSRYPGYRLSYVFLPSILIAAALGCILISNFEAMTSATLSYLFGFLFIPYAIVEVDRLARRFGEVCLAWLLIIGGMLVGGIAGTFVSSSALMVIEGFFVIFEIALMIAKVARGKQEVNRFVDVEQGVSMVAKPRYCQEETYLRNVESRCAMLCKRFGLSVRETDIVEMLVRGFSAKSIADAYSISYNTVKSHISHIYTKMGIHNHDELMRIFESL